MFTLFEETESEREWEKKTRKRTNEINHFHFVCSVNHCMNAKTKAWGVSWTFFATFCGILPASELYSFRFSFALLVWNLFVLLAFLLLLIFFCARCAISLCILCYVSLNIPFATFKANTDLQQNTHTHTLTNAQEIESEAAKAEKMSINQFLKQNSTKRNGRGNNWNVLCKNNCKREMKPQNGLAILKYQMITLAIRAKFNQNEIKSNTNTNIKWIKVDARHLSFPTSWMRSAHTADSFVRSFHSILHPLNLFKNF